MTQNPIQIQTGMSFSDLFKNYGTETQCADFSHSAFHHLILFICSPVATRLS